MLRGLITEKKENIYECSFENNEKIFIKTSKYPLMLNDSVIFKKEPEYDSMIDYDDKKNIENKPYFSISFEKEEDIKNFLVLYYNESKSQRYIELKALIESKKESLKFVNNLFLEIIEYSTNNIVLILENKFKPKKKFEKLLDKNLIKDFLNFMLNTVYMRCFYLLGLKKEDIKNYLKFYEKFFLKKRKIKDCYCEDEKKLWCFKHTDFKSIESIFKIIKLNPFLFLNDENLCNYIYKTTNENVDDINELKKISDIYKRCYSSSEFSIENTGENEKIKNYLKFFNLIINDNNFYIKKRYIIKKNIDNFIENFYLSGKLNVITGGPGTGKTTLIKEIEKKIDTTVYFLAYTGKAACKIREKVVKKEMCFTIDLFIVNEFKIDSNTVLIIDESSMISGKLMNNLIKKINNIKEIYFIGDKDQIPPVKWGDVFSCLIEYTKSKDILKVLNINYRQSSLLKSVVKNYNENNKFEYNNIIKYHDNSDLEDILRKNFSNKLDKFLFLSPFNETCDFVNKIFSKGLIDSEKVILCENVYLEEENNRYLIPNGSIGTIKNKKVIIDSKNLNLNAFDFKLCYCLTIHKMQGSECENLVLIIPYRCLFYLTKKLFYTAISRPKKKLIILTNIKDFKSVIENLK